MWFFERSERIDEARQRELMERVVEEGRARYGRPLRRVLLLPPDITRYHSGAGELTNMLYHILAREAEVDVIPTLGQHVPHTPEQNARMFGDIPEERIRAHHWRDDVERLGEVDADYVRAASGGAADWPIPVEVNRAVVDPGYDLVINVGQVVPHEVLGCANHNKNYFIGLGGKGMIAASHLMAACCGIENNLGQLVTPLRGCFNKAELECLAHVPDVYVLLVRSRVGADLATTGLYVGDGVEAYLRAARHAREATITLLEKPLRKVVCMMDGDEFHSTWVANKAVYRTRMAIADGGELVILAPGVRRFGEQPEVDRLIREIGYRGTDHVMARYRDSAEAQDLAHGTAHLIHGSSEGRFTITYAPGGLSREEVEGVGYNYLDLDEALARYDPAVHGDGLRSIDGEDVYLIRSPSLGLWAARSRFEEATRNNLAYVARMEAREAENPLWPEVRAAVEAGIGHG